MPDCRVMPLRVPLWMHSQARATVGDVEVVSMMTSISMAVLFVVSGWSKHESYAQRARALEYNSGCL